MEKINIETERLLIRNMKLADVEAFHAYRSIPEVTKYQGFGVMDKKAAKSFIEGQIGEFFGVPGAWVQYSIVVKGDGLVIGDCAIRLEKQDVRIAQIGITLSPKYQGQGFATEAMQGIISQLFKFQNVLRICEIVDVRNHKSIQLLERLKFKREGHFIENVFFKGAWGSEYQYALLKREWQKNQ